VLLSLGINKALLLDRLPRGDLGQTLNPARGACVVPAAAELLVPIHEEAVRGNVHLAVVTTFLAWWAASYGQGSPSWWRRQNLFS
jgi:hypothetical protein